MWHPAGEPAAVVQLAHGIAEYALRYEPFAQFMTAHGFLVTANDHLGHGSSVSAAAPRLSFGPKDGWRHAVEDLHTLRCLIGQRYPALPYYALGHSMGSFLMRTYLILYPGTVDGAILLGTGQTLSPVLAVGRVLTAAAVRRGGFDQASPFVEQLVFGAYNRAFSPNRTPCDWLSASEENVNRYQSDPLCGGAVSAGLFADLLGGIAFLQSPGNLRRMDPSIPVLFLSGAQDPVGRMGKGVRQAYESFQRVGVKDVSLKLYAGLRHEILNESSRYEVYTDILNWLMQRKSEG